MSVPIGDASNGLCGGMAFAAQDYFEAGHPPPADTEPPSEGALFEYWSTGCSTASACRSGRPGTSSS